MKAFALPLLAALIIFQAPTPLNIGQTIRQRNVTNNQIKQQIIQQAQEQKREQVQAKLTEKKQERIRNQYNKIERRITSAISRLDILSDRILARLDVLEGEGEDVTTLVSNVESAKTMLDGAEGMLTDLEAVVDGMVSSEEPNNFYPTVKDSVMEIKDTLKDVHRILIEVVTQIQGLRIGDTEND